MKVGPVPHRPCSTTRPRNATSTTTTTRARPGSASSLNTRPLGRLGRPLCDALQAAFAPKRQLPVWAAQARLSIIAQ